MTSRYHVQNEGQHGEENNSRSDDLRDNNELVNVVYSKVTSGGMSPFAGFLREWRNGDGATENRSSATKFEINWYLVCFMPMSFISGEEHHEVHQCKDGSGHRGQTVQGCAVCWIRCKAEAGK